jgi:hypothetical protein
VKSHEGELQVRAVHLLDALRGRIRSSGRRRRRYQLAPAGTQGAHLWQALEGIATAALRGGDSHMKAHCSYARYVCSLIAAVGFAIPGGGSS